MRYYEIAQPEHPAKRETPHQIASLYVHKAEWPDLKVICEAHGATLINVKPVPIIPTFVVEVLCPSAEAKMPLYDAWLAYCETSPHRPHTEEECESWGEQFNPFPDIPRDWTF
jgi:hypothetical protein